MGWHGHVTVVPKDALPRALQSGFNTDQSLFMDTARIRLDLGHREPVLLDEALRRTVEWERANPPGILDQSEFDYAAEDAVLHQLAVR